MILLQLRPFLHHKISFRTHLQHQLAVLRQNTPQQFHARRKVIKIMRPQENIQIVDLTIFINIAHAFIQNHHALCQARFRFGQHLLVRLNLLLRLR